MARLHHPKPVRRIGIGVRSMRGSVCVRGRQLPFESGLERDFLLILDADCNVRDVHGQPVRIHYEDDKGRSRHYTPDFLVEYDSGQRPQVLYEVKYRSDLREQWAVLRQSFLAARRHARRNRMRFSIVTERDIRGPFLDNWRFLRAYEGLNPEPRIEDHLSLTLAILGASTPAALLEAAYPDREARIGAIAPMWRLLAMGRIHCEMHAPLTMASPIWVNLGEGTP